MGCCNGHRWSSFLSFFALVFGILGCGLWQGLKKEDESGTSFIGIWTATAKVNAFDVNTTALIQTTIKAETYRGQYQCKDITKLLEATAVQAPLYYDDLPSLYTDAVSEVGRAGVDVDKPVRRRRVVGEDEYILDGGSGSGAESLSGTDCGTALERRCTAGRVFSVWATLFSSIVIPFALCAAEKKKWVVGFHFLSALGFLVCVGVLGQTYLGDLDKDSMACGQGADGPWTYGIAWIVIDVAFVLEFFAMFIAWCACKDDDVSG
jgi:hypothetical protein